MLRILSGYRPWTRVQIDKAEALHLLHIGWAEVQVLERRQGQMSAEAERIRIREALLRRRADEEWELLLRRLRDEAYVEVRLQPSAPVSTDAPTPTPTPTVQ